MSNYQLILDGLIAIGTVIAAGAAVYFGAIQPNIRKGTFRIGEIRKVSSHSIHDYQFIGKDGDMVDVGFFIEQISGYPTKDVAILVKKIWYWDEEDNNIKKEWPHFVPSELQWAAKDKVDFAVGVKRYCHLGQYGDPPMNDFVGCIFNLFTVENEGDPLFSSFFSMLPGNHKYEIELFINGENVQPKEIKFLINLHNPQVLGKIGDDGLPVGGNLKDAIEISEV